MRNPQPWQPEDPDERPPDSRRGALIGLLVIILLVAGALYLTHVLDHHRRLQDCALSGRSNCSNP